MLIPVYLVIFMFGAVIGSFLNVCIYRIPKKESIVVVPSHCMQCGYRLKWFDLIPILSWLFLKGKCRKCKAKISVQYPLIETANGLLYVLIFYTFYCELVPSITYCLLGSALIVLSVIDFRTYEIPVGINYFILTLGLIHLALHFQDWVQYGIGFIAVSGFIWIIFFVSKGRAIGGGDAKLMAAAGLLLGWKLAIFAFIAGCIYGSVIHIIRMRVTKEGHVLAMGPYLAAGIFTAVMWGETLLHWYLSLFLAK